MARSFADWRLTSVPKRSASAVGPGEHPGHPTTRDRRSAAELLSCRTPIASAVPVGPPKLVAGMTRRFVHVLAMVSALGAPAMAAAQEATAHSRSIAAALATEGTNRPGTIAGRATGGAGERPVRGWGGAVEGAGQLQSRGFEVAVQDASGGIRVFSRTVKLPVKEGDSVLATGTIRRYRGDRELLVTSFQIVPDQRRLPPPRDLAIDTAAMARH